MLRYQINTVLRSVIMKKIFILLFVGLSMSLISKEIKVREQDDFYGAINYSWLKDNKIPKGYSSWNNFNNIVELPCCNHFAYCSGTSKIIYYDFVMI